MKRNIGTIGALLIMATLSLAWPTIGRASADFDQSKEISVISREDGSGTRGAFIELFGIEQKSKDGGKKDLTTKEAVIAKQTDVMMTNIAADRYAIGYISLGSLNATVKAVAIDGATASAENVKDGSYPVARPFFIATKDEQSEATSDFIAFILSAQGQEIVGKHYIAAHTNAHAYQPGGQKTGKVTIAGSSSVTPVMEKLREGYLALNPEAVIEIQQSDSSAGLSAAISGICDIGMASRALKESEARALKPVQIAIDGIAVIVNPENPALNLSKEQVRQIFTGQERHWSGVIR
ncbi:MAG: substrate-binding domain-containing protein [Desulfobulbaceae bacterium]|jgi:phosphate transport system substrate-binding protein|nr:substrate-binding domain-containing protein [Desulfobulbaceae bacterium]